ncbi:MAG: hypothetical protein JOS17DRAFT_736901 [Linnemannia elongata]|nr:MAG: hypothetical protein JOS17DRAFT_736901 [Linnemannia elongata]
MFHTFSFLTPSSFSFVLILPHSSCHFIPYPPPLYPPLYPRCPPLHLLFPLNCSSCPSLTVPIKKASFSDVVLTCARSLLPSPLLFLRSAQKNNLQQQP